MWYDQNLKSQSESFDITVTEYIKIWLHLPEINQYILTKQLAKT